MVSIPNNFKDQSVCILGMGYVGLTLAAVMADVGFKVVGTEIRSEIVEKLKQGEPHFFEPGLANSLRRLLKEGNVRFTREIPRDFQASVYIITVGTSLDSSGKVRLDMIENASREVSGHLKEGDIVILRSTVKLGTTRKVVLPILEESGVNFDLAFCPERTLEGQALGELRHLPQIVGGASLEAAVRASQIFQFLTPTVIQVSSVETAEMFKLIDNASRDSTLAYANEVARMCDAVGVSATEVIKAGKLGYSRTNVPIPGPVGGPCLEKDSYILAEGLQELGVTPEITMAARQINERQPEEAITYLAKITRSIEGFPESPSIALLGIAFKGRPATDDLRGTTARPIFQALQHHFPKAEFRGYDPVVSTEKIKEFGLEPYSSIKEAITKAHLVLILNNHPIFAGMPIEDLAHLLARPSLIYDFWGNFVDRKLHLPSTTGYIALGSHSQAILPKKV